VSQYPFVDFSSSECVADPLQPLSSDLLSCELPSNQDSYTDWTDFDFALPHTTPFTTIPPISSHLPASDTGFDFIFESTGALWDPMQQLIPADTSLLATDSCTYNTFTDTPATSTSYTQSPEPRLLDHQITTSLPTLHQASTSSSPETPHTSSSTPNSTLKRPLPSEEPEPDKAEKRRRNNAAAAKYRQKKFDRISELEDQLAVISKDRDGLRLQLVRRAAEVDILRGMLAGPGK